MRTATILGNGQLAGAVALVVLTLAVPAIAEREPKLVTGVVVASGHEALIVRTREGIASFRVTAETFLPESLDADAPVRVRYQERNGRRIASEVTSAAAEAEPGVVARQDAALLDGGESLPSAAVRLPLLALLGTASLAASYLMRSAR